MDIAARREEITANVARALQLAAADRGIENQSKGQSVKSLCDQTGLPQTNVYRAMNGAAEPALHTVVILAEALGVTVDSLVRGRPEVSPGSAKTKRKAKE